MKKLQLLFIAALLAFGLQAQNSQIKGRVLEAENEEPIIGASVFVKFGDNLIGSSTDAEGYFTLKPLNSGTYNLTISYIGRDTLILSGVGVSPDEVKVLSDVRLKEKSIRIGGKEGVRVIAYKNPLLNIGDPSNITIDAKTTQKLPENRNPLEMISATVPGVQVSDDGKQMIMRGSRPGSNIYYIDGMRVSDLENPVPGGAIKNMKVYTGGIPAKYGDTTGGVVVIETKSYFDLYNQWKYSQ